MKMNLDYIAGFFDGEGTVFARKYNKSHYLMVHMSQMSKEVLNEIHLFLLSKGIKSYFIKSKPNENNRIYYRLQMTKKEDIVLFLNKIKNRTIVKKDRILEALDFAKNNKWVTNLNSKEKNEIMKQREIRLSVHSIAKKIHRNPTTVHDYIRKIKEVRG